MTAADPITSPAPPHPTEPVVPRTAFGIQLGLLTFLAVAVPAQLYLAIPVADTLRGVFHVGSASAAWTGSAFSLAYAAGFLLFGPLSDRYGRRPVLALGALATALTTAATSLSPTFGWFLTFRVLQGLAAASFAPVALAYVAEHAPAARRPLALSVLTTGLLGAGLAGQVYGQLLGTDSAWRAAFWMPALLYAAAALALHRLLAPAAPRGAAPPRGVLASFGRLLREPAALAVFAAALTVFGSFVALYAVLSDHLSGRLGYTGGQLLGVQAIGALGLAVAPVVNRLAGARGPRFLAVAGFLTALCGLLLAQYTAVPAILVAGTVVFVGGIGLVVPSLVGLLHQVVPYARGAAVSVNTTVLFVGASLGQVLAAGASYHRTLGVLSAAVLLAAGAVAATARLTPAA